MTFAIYRTALLPEGAAHAVFHVRGLKALWGRCGRLKCVRPSLFEPDRLVNRHTKIGVRSLCAVSIREADCYGFTVYPPEVIRGKKSGEISAVYSRGYSSRREAIDRRRDPRAVICG